MPDIRIKGGSRPIFLRPMGERGSAPEVILIRIFAYPGYKRDINDGSQFVHLWGVFPTSSSLRSSSVSSSLGWGVSYESRDSKFFCQCFLRVKSSESFPTSQAGESRVGASSSWALLPSTPGEDEPSARCRDDQAAVPRLRRRDGASTIPPFDPEHQQFPSPISRADIVPEAPFVARSGYTCWHEVRVVDHIGGGSDSSRGRECNAGRRVQGSRNFPFPWGFE